MSKNCIQTVLVSDTHIGHKKGLKSDTAKEDGIHSAFYDKRQEVLWESWKEFTKQYHDPDVLLLNGDIPDLLSFRSKEDEMWTHNAGEIREEAVKLMKMFGKPKKIFAIKGTPAHVDSEHLTLERDIAKELGAQQYHNRPLHPFMLINLAPETAKEAAVYHVTHHLNATTAWYRGTAPAKAQVSLMLNESHFIDRKVWGRIIGIIRSHVHHFWYEESDSRRMIVNPAWQLQTNWMVQKMSETPPDIGSVILNHHKDGSFWRERYRVQASRVRPPVFQAI